MNSVRAVLLAFALLAVPFSACASDTETTPVVDPTPTAPPQLQQPLPLPTSNIVVSDAVPTRDELRDMGITDQAAECFIETIDPEGTGTVQSAELFMEAFGACL